MNKSNKKKFLKPETVAVLNSMSLRARLIVEGYIIGQHKSPFHGYSVEFAEHRGYEPGDEIRHIDWKLFAKTDRLFVKRFEEETNLSAHIILDISKSMTYKSNSVTKLNFANSLTAALSYLMVKQQDAVGLIKFSNFINAFIPAKSKPSHLNIIFDNLNDNQTGNDTKIEYILHEIAERISKRGLIVLISDLLDSPDKIINGLKHFRHNKQEIIVFHIFDRKELDFDYNNPTKFIDMETSEEIITEPWHIRSNYKKMLNEHRAFFKKECHDNLIDYLPIITDQSLGLCLTEYLKKRRKLN